MNSDKNKLTSDYINYVERLLGPISEMETVDQDDISYSEGKIIGLKFRECNAIAVVNFDNLGTLIHLSGHTHPKEALEGLFFHRTKKRTKINDIYLNPGEVWGINIYHCDNQCWDNSELETLFKEEGINLVSHGIASYSGDLGETVGGKIVYPRDIIFDPSERKIYVFPHDLKLERSPIVVPIPDES